MHRGRAEAVNVVHASSQPGNIFLKGWKLLSKLHTLLIILMMKSRCACDTATETIKRFNFDSDGIPFVIDNSANCHTCTEKSYFINLHLFTDLEKAALGSIGTVGDGAIPEGFGDMQLT